MNNADEPLVSVLMTAYNREKYIAEAIESVLASDYSNFELIIVDDASKDTTVSIAEKYRQKDSRIKVFVNEKNLRQFANRNKAISYAKGKYIMNVDSDDKIFPDGISRLVKTMESFPSSSFGMYYPFEKGKPAFELDGKAAIRKHFYEHQALSVGPGGTILKTDFIKKIGEYPLNYEAAGDMYFNLWACCNSSIVMLPFDFFYYRVHGEQELNNPFSYTYTSYTYFRDAMQNLPLGLTEKETQWFLKKNKRRFVVNITRYFFSTFKLGNVIKMIKITGFTVNDFLQAVFQR